MCTQVVQVQAKIGSCYIAVGTRTKIGTAIRNCAHNKHAHIIHRNGDVRIVEPDLPSSMMSTLTMLSFL